MCKIIQKLVVFFKHALPTKMTDACFSSSEKIEVKRREKSLAGTV